MIKSVTFANSVQATLWIQEFLGQISDGHWENTKNTDWEVWHDTEVLVDEENVGCDFTCRKHNFNLRSKDLLEVIEKRLMAYARLHLAGFSNDQINVINSCFKLLDTYEENGYTEEYFANKKKQLLEFTTVEKVKEALAAENYNARELKKDLKEMKKILKTIK